MTEKKYITLRSVLGLFFFFLRACNLGRNVRILAGGGRERERKKERKREKRERESGEGGHIAHSSILIKIYLFSFFFSFFKTNIF